MGKKIAVGVLGLVLSLCLGLGALAQDSSVKGNLGGVVVDSTGAVVPGAKVTLSGPTGTQTINSENDGNFLFARLVPGTYSLKVEKQGFKVADAKAVQVEVGRTASIKVQLQPGAATETIEVSAEAVTVDTASTASGSNLSDTFYSKVPTPRNVSGLFYVAPGVADSGGSGRANPSISGGSGLENLYVADGVNITDAAFGGLGVFTRNQGSVGSGINLSFIKEVQVKTGGFEPQYGQATGGVVQIVTKSGGQAYHGAIAGYASSRGMAAPRL
ncbi:MAG TPA: TonB-dependent receptor, partial [Candidatus Angelobacter sp.]|nr:TonB-dependent receptor [Candidatus Angelobacter sp.]